MELIADPLYFAVLFFLIGFIWAVGFALFALVLALVLVGFEWLTEKL